MFFEPFNQDDSLTAGDVRRRTQNRGFEYRQTVVFETSGTFTKADYPWLAAVRIRMVGGGGGGGSRNEERGSAGGGAGADGESFFTVEDFVGATLSITVGAKGLGSSAGSGNATDGGDTRVLGFSGALFLNAPGGSAPTDLLGRGAGQGGTFDPEGVFSAPTNNLLNINGAPGLNGYRYEEGPGGNGGNSLLGHGGAGGSNFPSGIQGQDAPSYGGGGGGSFHRGTSRHRGGDGHAGVVIIDLYA